MTIALRRTLLVLALVLMPIIAAAPGVNTAVAADITIYDDKLSAEWADWSWNTTRNHSNTSPIHGNSYSLSVTYTEGWGGLYLHTGSIVDLGGYDHLSFWIHGGTAGNQRLRVVVNGDGGNAFQVTPQANAWNQVKVPLSSLGSPSTLTDLYWQDTTGGAQPTFYLDDISLLASSGPPPAPGIGPVLSIDAGAGRHAISEAIYGMNFADEQLARELRLPVRRWGGNSTSRYNWQNDTHNTGSDWYFENIAENNPNPTTLPDGSAADRFIDQDRRTGTKTLLTIPMIGSVPKQRVETHPYDCSFKVSRYGAQQSTDPWDTECGNGLHVDGSPVTGNDPSDTSISVGPSFITAWINHLTNKYSTAANGGVNYYNLDNEPMLWNSTHSDVHPQPATYDEIRDRTFQYAAAVKAADPSAKTLGPVLWGWCAYFFSAADGCGIGSDYRSHGNTYFIEWYLQQMKAYEDKNGVRILDYVDLHTYPQASGISLSSAGNASTQALRLRSTRSLWDQNYLDESWINDKIRLIPRMRDWVNANYPGTKLAITEYNWGGLESINGALAQADLLGIFGREGLDLAALWGPPTSMQPGAFAFRIYRNYDGAGHGFGDVGIQAASADQGILSIYAAQRSADSALTLVIINKTANTLTSEVSLAGSGFTPQPTAAVYRYSSANIGAIVRLSDQPLTPGSFSATFPGNSITLFVIMPGQGGLPWLSLLLGN
jgi:hypothetical protein